MLLPPYHSVISRMSKAIISKFGQLANCVNYADLNNSMVCIHGHVSAGFFHCDVLFLQGKHNCFHHNVASV